MILKSRLKLDDWIELSEFEGTLPYKALKKLIDVKVYNASQTALLAQNMEQVADMRGFARFGLELLKEIKNANKKAEEIKKERKKKQEKLRSKNASNKKNNG